MWWAGLVLYQRWDGPGLCCIRDEMGRTCAVSEMRWVGLVLYQRWDGSDLCCIRDEMGRACAVSEMRWVGLVLYQRWDGSDLCCISDEMGRTCTVSEMRCVGLVLYQRWDRPNCAMHEIRFAVRILSTRWNEADVYFAWDQTYRTWGENDRARNAEGAANWTYTTIHTS